MIGISLIHFIIFITLSNEKVSATELFSFLALYSYAVPFPLLFMFNINQWVIESRLKNGIFDLKISSSSIAEDLGQIEYIILEKNETLAKNDLKVQACIVGNYLFLLDQSYKEDLNEENAFVDELDTPLDSLRRMIEDENSEGYNFARGIALCSAAFPQISDDYTNISLEDKALLGISTELGVSLIFRDSKKMTVMSGDSEQEYKILAFKDFSITSKKCRILVQTNKPPFFLFYVKGPLDSMNDLINSQNSRNIEELRMKIPGIKMMAFGYRCLNQAQVKDFLSKYKNSKKSPVNREGRIEGVFEEYEEGLKFLGLVGTEYKVTKKVKNAVATLMQSGIKI